MKMTLLFGLFFGFHQSAHSSVLKCPRILAGAFLIASMAAEAGALHSMDSKKRHFEGEKVISDGVASVLLSPVSVLDQNTGNTLAGWLSDELVERPNYGREAVVLLGGLAGMAYSGGYLFITRNKGRKPVPIEE